MANNNPLMGMTFQDLIDEVGAEPTSSKSLASRNNRSPRNGSVEFNIIRNFGKLSNRKNAATFALVDWNGYQRYDLRAWNEDYTVPFKGLSFNEEEIIDLLDSLSNYVAKSYSNPLHTIDMGKTKAKVYHTVCELSSSTIKEILWTKMVAIVDWGYGQKYDFRKWTENFERCSKGVCLTQEEVDTLVGILESLDL